MTIDILDLIDKHGYSAADDVFLFLGATPRKFDTNTLSALGDLISAALRRRVLREVLESTSWNLSQAAVMLRITSGAPAVTRLIADLGLADAYAAAKKRGDVDPRGRKPRG